MVRKRCYEGSLRGARALPLVLVLVACSTQQPAPGDVLTAFTPESLTNLYFNHQELDFQLAATRWYDGAPIRTSCERRDGAHQRLHGDPRVEDAIRGLSKLSVRRMIGSMSELEVSEYGFGAHEATGYLVLSFATMEPQLYSLGRLEAGSDEIYAMHAGHVITLAAAPFRELEKLCP